MALSISYELNGRGAVGAYSMSDQSLVRLWLHGRPANTQRAYRVGLEGFRAFTDKPFAEVVLADLQDFADSLLAQSVNTQIARLSCIKSLLKFGHQLGALPVDVGRALRVPTRREHLAARILPETDVSRMLALTTDARERSILDMLYIGGLRLAEVIGLRWGDCQPRDDAGQVSVWGKGSKERVVLLPPVLWANLVQLRDGAGDVDFIFPGRWPGRPMGQQTLHRVVKRAARRAGLSGRVSAHWLRHCHASHALDRGAPISLVQATLGHSSVATTGKYLHARPGTSSALYLPG